MLRYIWMLWLLLCVVMVTAEVVDEDGMIEHTPEFAYHGRFEGKCGFDGIYYHDELSFVVCSHSHAYIQLCAPGTQNSNFNRYTTNSKYDYHDFCDVNLLEYGERSYGNGFQKGYETAQKKKNVQAPNPKRPKYYNNPYFYQPDRFFDNQNDPVYQRRRRR